MTVVALARIQRHAARLATACEFYCTALGFHEIGRPVEDRALARLLGLDRVTVQRMELGAQRLDLYETEPAGEPFPPHLAGNDLRFQHIAIVTTDIAAACARLASWPITALSTGGPQRLPPASGGVSAFKFYDPEGHPLELLQFPGPPASASLFTGYDHAAITVSDPARSVSFYSTLGLTLSARQLNHGPAQDALDALAGTQTDVLALTPPQPKPHLELLHYRQPRAPAATWRAGDGRADRLVFSSSQAGLLLVRDPDGHEAILEGEAERS